HPAARVHRPHRPRPDGRTAGGGLQDRQGAAGGAGRGRGQVVVPDEVLRGGGAALPRRAARPAAADLPRRRAAVGLLPRPRRAAAVRTHPDGDLAGDPKGRCRPRFPAERVETVRLVRAPGALPGLRRHTPAVSGLAGGDRGVTRFYYRRLRTDGEFEVLESTGATGSNWDAGIQHGSPPLALLTKLVEDSLDGTTGPRLRVGRLVMDILGPIPVAPVRVRAWTERPGSRISLRTAEMQAQRPDGSWRAVARLSAWLLAVSDTADVATDRHPPLQEGPVVGEPHAWHGAPGYLETIDFRRQESAGESGTVAWMTPLARVVDTDDPTPLQRLAMVVDSANGI